MVMPCAWQGSISPWMCWAFVSTVFLLAHENWCEEYRQATGGALLDRFMGSIIE